MFEPRNVDEFSEMHASQTKILKGWTKDGMWIYEVIFKDWEYSIWATNPVVGSPRNPRFKDAHTGSPRNPRFPIHRRCLQTTFHARMSIFKSGISGSAYGHETQFEGKNDKSGIWDFGNCRRPVPEIPDSRFIVFAFKPAVGNSLAFWTQTCLFTNSIKVGTTNCGWNIWENREKAGLSKTLMSCRRLKHTHWAHYSGRDDMAMRCYLNGCLVLLWNICKMGFTKHTHELITVMRLLSRGFDWWFVLF